MVGFALMSRPKILIVEDEADIRDLITLHLNREGYQVEEAIDGKQALEKLGSQPYDLYVLDWMLPVMSGLEIAKKLKQEPSTRTAPILMVTARTEPASIVAGLEAGADDYLTKPFEVPVLLARVRALLRRASLTSPGESQPTEILEFESLRIDVSGHQVFQNGEPLPLTRSEFKLLLALVQNRGKVLTRERLIALVQGEGVSVVDRAIDTHVFGLRKKLGSAGDLIETVRGVGYRIKLQHG
jgi:two-component system phosphate regulon response regulator PhoB